MNRFLFLLLTLGFSTAVFAQEIGYGFKAGLNFNTFKGDAETDDAGNTLEEFSSNTGFHVGATFTYAATELMGVRGEFMFSQKGGRRAYDGPSYYFLYDLDGNRNLVTGTREIDISINQSYLEIPVMGYFKPVKFLEIYAGGSIGFLVASNGFGELTFNGVTSTGVALKEFSHEMDVNYFSDNPRGYTVGNPPQTISFKGQNVPVPQTAGAYFEFTEDRGNLYNIIDAGLVGGLSVFFNKGLYVTGRVNYGLTDVTKSKADVSLRQLDNGEFITRDDDDRNFTIQASIGFSF
jgi:hypothetical protein